MSTLLINGCSYLREWKSCGELGNNLNFNNTVNLSVTGSCNERIFRTTTEYILKNRVDFVILALTFWNRTEAPWGAYRDYEGSWVNYSNNGIMFGHKGLIHNEELYQSYIQDRYRYDINEYYIDKLINEIITFTGWLSFKKIRYLIFSSVGGYFAQHKHIQINWDKLGYLKNDPGIIDLANWCSNQYMSDNGGVGTEKEMLPVYRHYNENSFYILNDFLYNYIITNNL